MNSPSCTHPHPCLHYYLPQADQVDWYNRTALALNKSVVDVPSSAWFHIPLPEYDTAFTCQWNNNITVDGSAIEFGAGSYSGMGKMLHKGCNGTLTGEHLEGVYSASVSLINGSCTSQ